jgi:hypothetical protein
MSKDELLVIFTVCFKLFVVAVKIWLTDYQCKLSPETETLLQSLILLEDKGQWNRLGQEVAQLVNVVCQPPHKPGAG